MSEGPIPGDSTGHITLAFCLAEVIGDLQNCSAPKFMIQEINAQFRNYRECDLELRKANKVSLFATLDAASARHPELLSKIVDVESRIDELERRASTS